MEVAEREPAWVQEEKSRLVGQDVMQSQNLGDVTTVRAKQNALNNFLSLYCMVGIFSKLGGGQG